MALELSEKAKEFLYSKSIEPAFVLKIDGLDAILTSTKVGRIPKFGDTDINFGDDGLIFGGIYAFKNQIESISPTSGTTNEITQQLDLDKGAVSSPSRIVVRLVDEKSIVTKLISPGKTLEDILYRYAELYWGDRRTEFPDDFVPLFFGHILEIRSGAGFVDLTIGHADDKKRSKIFVQAKSNLAQQLKYKSVVVGDVLIEAYPDILTTVQVQVTHSGSIPTNTANVSVTGYQITVTVNNTTAEKFMSAIKSNADANEIVKVSLKKGGNRNTIMPTTSGFVTLSSDTTIYLTHVNGFLNQVLPYFKTYVKIGEEIIRYTGIDVTNKALTGCIRTSLDSFGFTHDVGAEVVSFYELGDEDVQNSNPIDMALRLLLSGTSSDYFAEDIKPISLVTYGSHLHANGIFIETIDPDFAYGVTIGDYIDIYGASNSSNNQSSLLINDIFKVEKDVWCIIVNASPALVAEGGSSSLKIRLKSRFNVLPDGLGLLPKQVDVKRFEELKSTYFSSLPGVRLFIKEDVSGYELIDKELYLPTGFFSLPRRGRVSIGFSSPVLVNNMTKFVGLNETKNPSKVVLNRSVASNFYNSIIFRYDQDSVTDKFLAAEVILAQDSANRIKTKNRPLTIDARALRKSALTEKIIKRISRNLLNRYKFAAEWLDVELPFNVGFEIEVGDPVIFGDDDLQISDTSRGDRKFAPRIFEVVNYSKNLRTGNIRLRLLDTRYSISLRTGVFAPASKIESVISPTEFIIEQRPERLAKERTIWQLQLQREIELVSPNFSTVAKTTLLAFGPGNDWKVTIAPVSVSFSAGWFMRLPMYNNLGSQSRFYKDAYVFYTPSATVVSVTSPTKFTVSPADFAKFFVGSLLRLRTSDFSTSTSVDDYVRVTDLNSALNEVTIDTPVTWLAPGIIVDGIGFESDNGSPYTWT